MATRIKCRECGVDNSEEAKYCRHCGRPMSKPSFWRPRRYESGPTNCPHCGKRIWLKDDQTTYRCIHCNHLL